MSRIKIIEQAKAKALRSQGWSLNDIARELKVSKGSVSVWVRDIQLTQAQLDFLKKREIYGGKRGQKTLKEKWQKYRELNPKPNKGPRWPKRTVDSFFDTWNSEMAYVLGYFAADGCMYMNKRGSCYIGFTSTDRELIETVKRLMGVTNNIEEYQPKGNCKRGYTLQIGSLKIYQRLLELGFTPNKSLTLKFPNVPDEVLGHFVRGYLDGDGCVDHRLYKAKDRPGIKIILTIKFTSGSRQFLLSLQNRLFSLADVGIGCLSFSGTGCQLSYSAKTSTRQLYKFMYPVETVPCLARKRDKFQKGIFLREQGPVA